MSTLLVKTFPNVDAVSKDTAQPLHSEDPVDVDLLGSIIEENKSVLSKSFATNMPDSATVIHGSPGHLIDRSLHLRLAAIAVSIPTSAGL